MIKILLWTARLSGLAALLAGAAFWLGQPVPLHAHMGLGGILVLALLGLGGLSLFRHRIGLGIGALVLVTAIPTVGMLQLTSQIEARWLVQLVHVLLGLGGIALAEIQAKRLRSF